MYSWKQARNCSSRQLLSEAVFVSVCGFPGRTEPASRTIIRRSSRPTVGPLFGTTVCPAARSATLSDGDQRLRRDLAKHGGLFLANPRGHQHSNLASASASTQTSESDSVDGTRESRAMQKSRDSRFLFARSVMFSSAKRVFLRGAPHSRKV